MTGILTVLAHVYDLRAYPGSKDHKPPDALKPLASAHAKDPFTLTELEKNCQPLVVPDRVTLVLLGGPETRRVPGTALIAVWGVKFTGDELQAALQHGETPVVARCFGLWDTSALRALQIPLCLQGCLLRLTLPDGTTKSMAKGLVKQLVTTIQRLHH